MIEVSARLFLLDHEVEVDIGVHDFEKAAPQRVLVSVEIEIGEPPAEDDIADALDYDFLRRGIAALAASRRFELQETFCREIVALVARREEARAGRVSVRKPDVYPDCAAVGVEMSFTRTRP